MADDILLQIVETKRREVAALPGREKTLLLALERAPSARDLAGALRGEAFVAVMAEVKRRSPGAGPIRPELDPVDVATGYEEAGAAAVSVLTDQAYFGGSLDDVRAVREAVSVPVFRKEFIVHPLQLVEARGAGADGTLLIARILTDGELASLHAEALAVGLAPLVEVHDEGELDRALAAGARLIGINNRNLATFTTSLDVTLSLLEQVPPEVTLVSESGIRTPEEVDRLGEAGVHAVLVGEAFLRAADPGAAAAALVGRKRSSAGRPATEGEE